MMDKKLKRKLDDYKSYTYGQIAREALKLKGNLRRKQDIDCLKESDKNSDILFDNRDHFFQREITKSLSKLLSIPYIDIRNERFDKSITSIIPPDIINKHEVLPIIKKGDKVVFALANPFSANVVDNLPQINGYSSQFVLCDRFELNKVISNSLSKDESKDTKKQKGTVSSDAIIKKENVLVKPQEDSVIVINDDSPASVIDTILKKAIANRATDVHFESNERDVKVRFRVDGMLFDQFVIPGHLTSSTISRIKVVSNLDITENRLPQDGRMTVNIDSSEYHLRVATLPTKRGENIVFRIIQEGNIFKGLEHLGLEPEDCKLLKSIIFKPHGMVLVTGPIGSGKTTTLYTALNELNTKKSKIVTIEDPVECLLSGIAQVEIDPKIDVNFVNSLRSILRQDADILMVGEIRDTETAKIAVRAALTGQLLFSTLHAVDTAGAVTTLRNFDVPPFLIASALNGIVAQRLVRKICDHCKVGYIPATRLFEQLGVDKIAWNIEFAYGKGCEKCGGIGYFGQTAIFEILQTTEAVKDAIINQAKESEIRELSGKEGLKTLRERGIKKVIDKVTTPEEVMREIFLIGGKL